MCTILRVNGTFATSSPRFLSFFEQEDKVSGRRLVAGASFVISFGNFIWKRAIAIRSRFGIVFAPNERRDRDRTANESRGCRIESHGRRRGGEPRRRIREWRIRRKLLSFAANRVFSFFFLSSLLFLSLFLSLSLRSVLSLDLFL